MNTHTYPQISIQQRIPRFISLTLSLAGHDFSDMGDLNEIHKYAIAPGGIVCQGGAKRGGVEMKESQSV